VNTFTGVVTTLASLFGAVLLGAVIPVIPTGAAVSAAAVLAWHGDPLLVPPVVLVGAVAAYLGDAVMFAICRAGGEALMRRIRLSRKPIELAETVKHRIERGPVVALLVSRLVPAGRVPMLLAAAVVGISWRRFAVANITACVLWSAMYAVVGIFGGAILPKPWQGIVAAVLIVLTVSYTWNHFVNKREQAAAAAAAEQEAAPTGPAR
jgi:membrane protein DedA with SNARE-associated domain